MQCYMIYNLLHMRLLHLKHNRSIPILLALCAPPGRVACIQQLYFSPLLSPYALPGLKAIWGTFLGSRVAFFCASSAAGSGALFLLFSYWRKLPKTLITGKILYIKAEEARVQTLGTFPRRPLRTKSIDCIVVQILSNIHDALQRYFVYTWSGSWKQGHIFQLVVLRRIFPTK